MATTIETRTPPTQITGNFQLGKARQVLVDAEALAERLRERIRGEVRFDAGSRALYATDASNYRQVPIGVVIPRDTGDVIQAVAEARAAGAPLLTRGGGTSLAGQCCNAAVILDMSKYMSRVLEIDPDKRLGRVQPGCVLDDLRHAAEQYHLTFGPDPATHDHCTLGGMLGNNSCGVHALMSLWAGNGARTSDNTHGLEILTHEGLRMRVGATSEEELEQIIRDGGRRGEIYAGLKRLRDRYGNLIRERYPKIMRRVSGYNLDELLPENGFNVARALVGTESTCVVILEATLCLVRSPRARSLLVLGYPDISEAGDHVPEILKHQPIGLEGIDEKLFDWVDRAGTHSQAIRSMPSGHGFLLVEFGGENKQVSDDRARRLMDALKSRGGAPTMKLFDDPQEEEAIWKVREGALGSTAWVPGHPDTWPGWEDSAVPTDKVGDYLRDLRALMRKYDYHPSLYGHLGQGCIHCRVGFDLYSAKGIETYKAFVEEAADLVVRYGGSLSGEHGDGQSRGALLEKIYGPELIEAFREFKAIWDPEWKMNPGKVIDPYPIDANLRLGADYDPPSPRTHFQFPADQGTFARATLRCVGVGECRKHGHGTMCPSYMVTREEMHSTRGRAHLLFEMLEGDPLTGGWKSEHVKEALDLCLACKGCKGECPVKVDMATYKAEFLSHYYEGRIRPRHAYAFGLIHQWARLAMIAPRLVNLFTQTPVLRGLAKRLAGMATERRIPAFAPQTFKDWFKRRPIISDGKAQVMLWPDTFNNHFFPQVAKAAVNVLEDAGFNVTVPMMDVCCGRPLYDYGMLDTAKRWLRDILDKLRPAIRSGVPIVGLEPSCVSVFRDELINLFPHDQDAQRLSKQTYLLSEFLEEAGYQPPALTRRAVVHGHCHHKALMKMGDEEQVLKKLGLDFEVLDSGCCGMAGAFGFEEGEHYAVSMQCGERVLLPAVRRAAADTLIVADGFSCREQIAQTTRRRALHLAEVLDMALHQECIPAGNYPERLYENARKQQTPDGELARPAMLAGAVLAGITVGYLIWRRTRS
jgi:FAD/FMN-containing dehydrogenase/Fe-S oxidoreductase